MFSEFKEKTNDMEYVNVFVVILVLRVMEKVFSKMQQLKWKRGAQSSLIDICKILEIQI